MKSQDCLNDLKAMHAAEAAAVFHQQQAEGSRLRPYSEDSGWSYHSADKECGGSGSGSAVVTVEIGYCTQELFICFRLWSHRTHVIETFKHIKTMYGRKW